jgi:SAM-dependent methyltransferase
MSNQKMMELFFEFFEGMPQQAPGSAASTGRAWAMLSELPEHPQVLDAGCGAGRQTLELARLSSGRITAVDLHQAFLAKLDAAAREEGLEDHVRTLIGDMGDLDLPASSFDVVWSEGAIYNVGFEAGISHWKRLLTDQGWVVVTECCWLTATPTPECASYWAEEYPDMPTVDQCLAAAKGAGYLPVDHFTLPDSDWSEHYYAPMEARLPEFRKQHGTSRDVMAIVHMFEKEMEIRRRFSEEYGYVCFVMKRALP